MTLPTLFAAVIALATFCLAVVLPSADPDTYWHLASARWMVDHGQLLTRDPFSSTAANAPYSVGEWAGELVWYAAYLAGGWQGIAILRALVVAVTAFFTAQIVLLVQARPVFAIAPLLAALAIGKTTWTDRPQLFTLALFSLFLFVLLRSRLVTEARGRELWILPPLLLLWTNLHGGYAIGLALITLFGIDAVLRRAPPWRTLLAVLVAGVVLSTLNPEAFGPLGAAGHVTNPPRFIAEELPPDLFTPQGFTFGLLLVAALASAILAPDKFALIWVILLVPLIWLGLSAQRHLPLAAIPLAAYVAAAAPPALRHLWPSRGTGAAAASASRIAGPIAAGILLVAALAAVVVAVGLAPRAPDETAYPAAALAALRTAPRELLNEYDWGGYLIWNAPERPVFIDGRLFLYVPDVDNDYRALLELHPGFRAVLDARHVGTVLLRPDRPLVAYLVDAGWTVLARDERFVLLRRT
ncbi:MAG: hypothetical protein E6I87_06090 [Chloroflexi bacterium]|nr:MAG: hypothetical protein E6I87_06090 [Chloroflexota bacterium]